MCDFEEVVLSQDKVTLFFILCFSDFILRKGSMTTPHGVHIRILYARSGLWVYRKIRLCGDNNFLQKLPLGLRAQFYRIWG